jgi:glycosyltransferase involved in cell wall biosynthesis
MYILSLSLFSTIAFFWLTYGAYVIYGASQLLRLRNFPLASDENCPRISILFAARDEAEKLPAALQTLLELDYPNLEIIAADDRSTDSTPQILKACAAKDARLRVVRINVLPAGWLGKTHGLQEAYEVSTGEWLLFTDADVQLRPDTLRRAISLVAKHNFDHLTLLCSLQMKGFWEKVTLTFFALGFHLMANPHAASNPRSGSYMGVGAFQLVRRAAYEAIGTHRRLALEVVDDMKLARNFKIGGFRSCVALGTEFVTVRWHEGFGNIIRGVTKNFFAAAGYSIAMVTTQALVIIFGNLLPFLALPFLRGLPQLCAAIAVSIALCFHAGVALLMSVSPLYALTHPIGAILFDYMLLRSTAITLWQGGVRWRDTFYPLDVLRRGGA